MALTKIKIKQYPSGLDLTKNGRLTTAQLETVHGGGLLHPAAARAWDALAFACLAINLPLTYTGCYRSGPSQVTLFKSRYAVGGTLGGCKLWDSDGNGGKELWCKKPVNGKTPSTAAVPYTSNHGLGVAIDVAFDIDPSDGIGPDDAAAITNHPQWVAFQKLALECGFAWELDEEPWHIHLVNGDVMTQKVLDIEAFIASFPPAPAPPAPAPPTPAPARRILKEGMEGLDVAYLQNTLRDKAGQPLGKTDGKFGPKTKAAVVAVQKFLNVKPVDGIVGPDTWKVIDQIATS